jgi:cytochrome c biogenesis protein CcmG/thiol:disulfide interchange protein DsbE
VSRCARSSFVKSLAVTALVALVCSLGAPVKAGVPRAGQPAPPFTLPRAAGGGKISLASLRGRPVYLNFFASWCSPCAEETPWVVEFYKKYRSRGLVTLGINELENAKKALEFAKQHDIPYPVLIDDGPMGKDYGVIAMPLHVFIDRRGKVSTFRLGEMTRGEIEAAIKKIL